MDDQVDVFLQSYVSAPVSAIAIRSANFPTFEVCSETSLKLNSLDMLPVLQGIWMRVVWAFLERVRCNSRWTDIRGEGK